MKRHTYRPIEEAPRDGTPICGVCGGVEMPVSWEGPPLNYWSYWDEEDDSPAYQKARPQPTEWREMF